jgi:hypothetical protein
MTMRVTAFNAIGRDAGRGEVPAGVMPPVASPAQVAMSGVSAATTVLPSSTRLVRIYADEKIAVRFGTGSAPTATVDDLCIPAGTAEYFTVTEVAAAAGVFVAGIVTP